MNRPLGIGDFIASFKGDTPGHPFRGNQYEGGSGIGEGDKPTDKYYSRSEDLGDVEFSKPATYSGHKQINVTRKNKAGQFESPSADAIIYQNTKDDPNTYAIYLGHSTHTGHFAGTVNGLSAAKNAAKFCLYQQRNQKMNTNIRHCARCGGNHDDIEIKPLNNPIIGGDLEIIANYWATCPTTGDPILIYVYEHSEVKEAL